MINEYIVKILTLGDTTVGKTSIILRYTKEKFNNVFLATIGIDFQKKIVNIGNNKVNVVLWDTAGQERFKKITSQYLYNGDGAILVFDITQKNTFERINYWLEELEKKKNIEEMSLVLVGNKIDLNDKREVSIDDINKFSQERKIKYFETSAKNNIGIEEMMNYIVKKTLKIIKKRNDENNEENITILSFDQKEKKGSC